MKQCKKCGVKKDESLFEVEKRVKSGIGANCKDCHKRYFREQAKIYYQNNPEKFKQRNRGWWKKNPEKTREVHLKSRMKLKEQVWKILSDDIPKCACCGESEQKFLSVDHIHGNGNKDRKLNGPRPSTMYRHVRDSKNPREKYQILCFNCNLAKGFNGSCPHQNKNQ